VGRQAEGRPRRLPRRVPLRRVSGRRPDQDSS
jgi:hypothetical protein